MTSEKSKLDPTTIHQFSEAIIVAIANINVLPKDERLYIQSSTEATFQLKRLFFHLRDQLPQELK